MLGTGAYPRMHSAEGAEPYSTVEVFTLLNETSAYKKTHRSGRENLHQTKH